MKLLFEIFKNNIPILVEPFEGTKYEIMYKTLEELVPQTIELDDGALIHNVFQMYGKVIVGYERYLMKNERDIFYLTKHNLFDQAIEYFAKKNDMKCLKVVQELQEEISLKHCKDNGEIQLKSQ
jgi:hypothetical protein